MLSVYFLSFQGLIIVHQSNIFNILRTRKYYKAYNGHSSLLLYPFVFPIAAPQKKLFSSILQVSTGIIWHDMFVLLF